ncbi:glycosyltransferase family protein [Colwellia psychrerythraea]|uniref:Oligosaccharide biosynthesis protein Alg14 like protein n=1 Tax=Colwellia psychrerythraea TaxID=28229 RepID=A0A099KXW8_COLPS|nr:hypothetical protein [Colwellia psychrerythraea]KGJ94697.1 Oligosaccharide biosynthesis protein Alg14 like protein [Colwellia psychrerythraea]
MNFEKKKILVILAGGGFLGQMKQVIRNLNIETVELYYVTAEDSTSVFKELDDSKCYIIPKTTHFSTRSISVRIRDFLKSFWSARKIVSEVKPDIIISVASSMAIPIFIWSISQGAKRVFIESLTRVSDLSRTGKIIYRLKLANRFYVQWKEIKNKYPKTIYKGKIL